MMEFIKWFRETHNVEVFFTFLLLGLIGFVVLSATVGPFPWWLGCIFGFGLGEVCHRLSLR